MPTSSWEIATATGTIVAALAMTAAVVAALVIGGRDRRAADHAVQVQLEAQRDAARREHELDLLLALQRQVARYAAHMGDLTVQRESRTTGRGLLLALADATSLAAVRGLFAFGHSSFGELPRIRELYPDLAEIKDQVQLASQLLIHAEAELAEQIRTVAHG